MKNSPTSINLIVFILFTIVVWIAFSIYSTFSKPTETDVPSEVLENFDARLDAEAISRLQQSIYLDDSQLSESVSTITVEEPEEEVVIEEEVIEDEVDAELTETEEPADETTEVEQP